MLDKIIDQLTDGAEKMGELITDNERKDVALFQIIVRPSADGSPETSVAYAGSEATVGPVLAQLIRDEDTFRELIEKSLAAANNACDCPSCQHLSQTLAQSLKNQEYTKEVN